MSETLLQKIWRTSPATVVQAVRQRLAGRHGPRRVPPSWVRIQAGALKDREFLLAAELGGSWREMVEGTYDRERLALNLERNRDLARIITVIPQAVAAEDGTAEFVFSADIDSGDSSCSHLDAALPPRPADAYAHFRRETVPTVRLDTLLTQRPGEIPKVLKIDVEGAEWLVLQGGCEFFTRHKPAILMEVHDIRLMLHVGSFLRDHGYQILGVDEAHATPSRCFIVAK